MSDVNMAPPPGGPPKPPAIPGAPGGPPRSPLGGPSGPGASPMVSPGTGAGMQARAMQGVKRIIDDLMAIGKDFDAGTPAFNGIVSAIKSLNSVFSKPPTPEAPKTPLPVAPQPPGMGLGGAPKPPTGLPTAGAPQPAPSPGLTPQ
jgi:hypothetical protein